MYGDHFIFWKNSEKNPLLEFFKNKKMKTFKLFENIFFLFQVKP